MLALSAVLTDPRPVVEEPLVRALRTDRPEQLSDGQLLRLTPQDWARPHHRALDLDTFVQSVLQHLSAPRMPVVQTKTAPAVAHRLPRGRRGTMAWEHPHAMALVLAKARHDPRWYPVAQQALRSGVPEDAAWSWGWVWALPDAVQAALWADAPSVSGDRFAGQVVTRRDSDGFSLWEALVQPRTWNRRGAERLLNRFGQDSAVFDGGLVAAWRVNNGDAQRWWLEVNPRNAVPAELSAWHAHRAAQNQLSPHVVQLERQVLHEALPVLEPLNQGRRRL